LRGKVAFCGFRRIKELSAKLLCTHDLSTARSKFHPHDGDAAVSCFDIFGAKHAFLCHFYTRNEPFCQDRLGTNIGKALKTREAFFAGLDVILDEDLLPWVMEINEGERDALRH
jgi:hypothetical protein